MPWRRPRKKVDRPVNVSKAIEETLEDLSAGEDEDDSVELADVDGASIVEAASGEADTEQRTPSRAAKVPLAFTRARLVSAFASPPPPIRA